jgi:hypothetical protein
LYGGLQGLFRSYMSSWLCWSVIHYFSCKVYCLSSPLLLRVLIFRSLSVKNWLSCYQCTQISVLLSLTILSSFLLFKLLIRIQILKCYFSLVLLELFKLLFQYWLLLLKLNLVFVQRLKLIVVFGLHLFFWALFRNLLLLIRNAIIECVSSWILESSQTHASFLLWKTTIAKHVVDISLLFNLLDIQILPAVLKTWWRRSCQTIWSPRTLDISSPFWQLFLRHLILGLSKRYRL